LVGGHREVINKTKLQMFYVMKRHHVAATWSGA
jgi:hypothetical protein